MAGRSAIAGSESSVLGSNERSTAMTEVGRMSVGELVGKVLADQHTDVLCQAVVWLAQELMEAEVTQAAGASYGERSGDRVTRRNGYRERPWDTRVGSIELAIPKLRQGSYFGRRPAGCLPPPHSAQVAAICQFVVAVGHALANPQADTNPVIGGHPPMFWC